MSESAPAPEHTTSATWLTPDEAPSVTPARPSVRWGALVWSLLFAATAALTLWFVDPARGDVLASWFSTLAPLTAALYAVVAVGALVAIFGVVGLLRRGERSRD